MQVEVNHVMNLRFNCGVGPTRTFNQAIHCPIANPDGFFVRSISYGNPAIAEIMNYSIWTDIVNDSLGFITTGQTSNPQTYFSLHGVPVNGFHTFRIDDQATAPSIVALNCFTVQLEFVRYHH